MRSYCVLSLCDGANTDPSMRLLLLESWQIGRRTVCLKHKHRAKQRKHMPLHIHTQWQHIHLQFISINLKKNDDIDLLNRITFSIQLTVYVPP